MEVPHGNISITAAGEADFGVGADGQGVARRRRGGELSFDTRRLRGQIPDGQRAGLASHDQCAAIGQQLTRADVVIPVLLHTGHKSQSMRARGQAASGRFRKKAVAKGRKEKKKTTVITNQYECFSKLVGSLFNRYVRSRLLCCVIPHKMSCNSYRLLPTKCCGREGILLNESSLVFFG